MKKKSFDAKNLKILLNIIVGSFLIGVSVNFFVTPMGLYSGGVLGFCQLLKIPIEKYFVSLKESPIDISGIIYQMINIPILYVGFKNLGRNLLIKTIFTVFFQSLFIAILPVPKTVILDDYLTNCIVAGLVGGIGGGIILREGSSAGGGDVIGLVTIKKYKSATVGKVNMLINLMVYSICLFLFDLNIVVYSLIVAIIGSLTADKLHTQNINTTVMIFSKDENMGKALMNCVNRGVTSWQGSGEYTKQKTNIYMIAISKYEMQRVKKCIKEEDPHAFAIFSEGSVIEGNFIKRL